MHRAAKPLRPGPQCVGHVRLGGRAAAPGDAEFRAVEPDPRAGPNRLTFTAEELPGRSAVFGSPVVSTMCSLSADASGLGRMNWR